MKRIYFHHYRSLHELKSSGNPQNENKIMQDSAGDMKMNCLGMKNIFYSTFLIFLGFFLFSCEKNLDLVPKTNYSETNFFTTVENFELFTNQFYMDLPAIGYDYTRDEYTDLFVSRSVNTVSDGSYFATATNPTWETSYQTIRNATYLIEKGTSSDLQDAVAVYVGEAKFFRALSYFNLFRDFGGVPIIDKVLDLNDDELLYGPRNSRDEVVNYIMKDLDDAINVLPVQSAVATNDLGRVSKGAALALKARIALFEGTWRKFRSMSGYETLLDMAIDASGQIISSGEYEIFDRRDVLGDESYRYFFILDKVKANPSNLLNSDQKEYILVSRYDEIFRPQPIGSINDFPFPTRKFADMFLCTDGLPIDKSPLFQGKQTITSEYENRDLRMINDFTLPETKFWEPAIHLYYRDWNDPDARGYVYIPFIEAFTSITGYMLHKFQPEIEFPSMNFPVIRYAEVLLINAEALFERNGSITDDQLNSTINILRDRAGIALISNAFVSSNGLDMQTEIRRERSIELCKEGQRFDDLRRWKTAETEMPQSLKGVLWTGTQWDTDPRFISAAFPLDGNGYLILDDESKRQFSEKNYLFPLPTRQILLNPNLEQNPGWE